MVKIFLDPYDSSEESKNYINELAETILYGIKDGTYSWEDDYDGYVVPIEDLKYDFPDDNEELASIGEKLANALPEQAEELGINTQLGDDPSVAFEGSIIVVS